jgi:hypothetical protein
VKRKNVGLENIKTLLARLAAKILKQRIIVLGQRWRQERPKTYATLATIVSMGYAYHAAQAPLRDRRVN